MSKLQLIEISKLKNGTIYNIKENNQNIKFYLKNVTPMFKPDKFRNTYYIKWNVINSNLTNISKIENVLENYFIEKNIKRNIINKEGYPLMLNTKFIYSKQNPIIINGSVSNIVEFITNNMKEEYDICLEMGKIFIDETSVKFPLNIKSLEFSKVKLV